MAPYSRKLAIPFSACLLVMAAVNVVYEFILQLAFSSPPEVLQMIAAIYLSVIDVTNSTYTNPISTRPTSYKQDLIPILTCGFERSKAVAYERAALITTAPFCLLRACCRGLTALP